MVSHKTQEHGISIQDVLGYLTKKGLVELISAEEYDDPHNPGPGLTLTHNGVLEAENLVSQRLGIESQQGSSSKQSIQTVIQTFNAPVGAVQTGAKSTSHISQTGGLMPGDVIQLISELRGIIQNSATGDKEEALEVVDALSEEIERSQPRNGRLRAFMRHLSELTVNTASKVITNALCKKLGID